MPVEVVVELIRLLPTLLWVIFTAVLIAVFYRPLTRDLIPRMSGLKVMGFEIQADVIREKLDKASSPESEPITNAEKSQLLERIERVAQVIKGARILWVDDLPENNTNEREFLESLGIIVDTALDTESGLRHLRRIQYDVVVSDMSRPEARDAGAQLARLMYENGFKQPVIIYTWGIDPSEGLPPFVASMTERPDQLAHEILDVLERNRW